MGTTTADHMAHPTRSEIELAVVLHALSDPVRLRMVAELARTDREASCGSFDTLRRDDLEARFPGLLDTILQAAPT